MPNWMTKLNSDLESFQRAREERAAKLLQATLEGLEALAYLSRQYGRV